MSRFGNGGRWHPRDPNIECCTRHATPHAASCTGADAASRRCARKETSVVDTTRAGASKPAAERVQRPQARTTERREAVLKAAMNVFGARGYNKGTLAEVAEQAGMTHAGVLHHFGSKEGLLIAVLSYRDGEAIAGVAGRQQVEGPAFLEHLIDTVQQNETRPGVVQTYTVLSAESVTQDHPAQEYFRGRMARLRAKLEDVMDQVSGGVADAGDVRDA